MKPNIEKYNCYYLKPQLVLVDPSYHQLQDALLPQLAAASAQPSLEAPLQASWALAQASVVAAVVDVVHEAVAHHSVVLDTNSCYYLSVRKHVSGTRPIFTKFIVHV